MKNTFFIILSIILVACSSDDDSSKCNCYETSGELKLERGTNDTLSYERISYREFSNDSCYNRKKGKSIEITEEYNLIKLDSTICDPENIHLLD